MRQLPERIVMVRFERQHAVVAQPRGAAPDYDVAMPKRNPDLRVSTLHAAEQEHGGNAQ